MNHLMIEEARRAPALIQQVLEQPNLLLKQCVEDLRQQNISHLVTIARGSSDHAAQFFSHVLARSTGMIPASLPPSLVTLYQAPLRWQGTLALAISQSGASPDLCRALEQAREGGALTLALVNHLDSPLAQIAQYVCPMGAGEEKSVAATKTFLLSLVHALMISALWSEDRSMGSSLRRLPFFLEKALQETQRFSLDPLQAATSILVISRGQGLPIAQEIALKFNEVCRLPALAYSSAEFRHGPMALIQKGDPVLVIGMRGPELPGLIATVEFLQEIGAKVLFVAPVGTPHTDIPYPVDADHLGDPLIAVQILYLLIARLAVRRGHNPDQPAHLRKVTMTL